MILIYYIIFILTGLIVIYLNFEYNRKPKEKELFDANGFNWKYAVLFSVYDLSKALEQYNRKYRPGTIYIEFESIKFYIEDNMNAKQIENVLIKGQNSILSRYESRLAFSGNIIAYEKLFYIWLVYSCDRHYRKNFLGIVNNMVTDNEISDKLRKEILNIFYSKRNN